MINPAVSLYKSVSRIEDLLNDIPGGPKKIGVFFNRMLSKFTELYEERQYVDINDEFLYSVYMSNLVSRDEAGGMTEDGLPSIPVNIIAPQQLLNCGWIYEK